MLTSSNNPQPLPKSVGQFVIDKSAQLHVDLGLGISTPTTAPTGAVAEHPAAAAGAPRSADWRLESLSAAVAFAQRNNLLGVLVPVELLVRPFPLSSSPCSLRVSFFSHDEMDELTVGS